MGQPTIQVLGAYKIESTNDLLRVAMEWKYAGIEISEAQRREAEASVLEELSSVVLLELLVTNADDAFSADDFKQSEVDQAAYDEAYLTADGTGVISQFEPPEVDAFRIAFFLHFFDPEKPLVTSYGIVPVPKIQKMPERLHVRMPYHPVD